MMRRLDDAPLGSDQADGAPHAREQDYDLTKLTVPYLRNLSTIKYGSESKALAVCPSLSLPACLPASLPAPPLPYSHSHARPHTSPDVLPICTSTVSRWWRMRAGGDGRRGQANPFDCSTFVAGRVAVGVAVPLA